MKRLESKYRLAWYGGFGWPGRWYLLPMISVDINGDPFDLWSVSVGWLNLGLTLTCMENIDYAE